VSGMVFMRGAVCRNWWKNKNSILVDRPKHLMGKRTNAESEMA
jgi:hypothetical protein